MARVQRGADADTDRGLLVADAHRRGERGQQPLPEHFGRVQRVEGFGDHPELVAAELRDDVRRAADRQDALAHDLQDPVAGGVALLVVDRLEAIRPTACKVALSTACESTATTASPSTPARGATMGCTAMRPWGVSGTCADSG